MKNSASARLDRQKHELISRWEKRAFREVASAMGLESLALRDSLPDYIDHLIQALSRSRKMDPVSVTRHNEEALRIANLHGSARAISANYVLGEVIAEYHILREVIFETLEAEGPLTQAERDIILTSIEQTVGDAAVQFTAVHADIQQKFINTLTHDLKNPITSAKANAQLIMRRSDDSELCVNSATRIVANMNRLDSMIINLLDASRLRFGLSLDLQISDCDLMTLVRDVVEEMDVIHGNRFRFNCTEEIFTKCSPDAIRRALENLIMNAVKYSTPNTPITVSLKRLESQVEISIHNEGPAIPENEQPLLFQQYRRAKTAKESIKTGWGLGLTLVKGVMDAHRGSVRVQSTEAEGTRFVLNFPL